MGVVLAIVAGTALVLSRDFDVTRFDTLELALIFFVVMGYLLVGPPWPSSRRKR
jgi:hypothetical protein